jgi:hypothetical protein
VVNAIFIKEEILMNTLLTLTVSFLIQGSVLVVSYTVVNQSMQTVYLTNLATRRDSEKGPIPDKSMAFIYFEDDIIHITKRKPSLPENKFYTPVPHYVTPLKGKEVFTETFSLTLPLKEVIPYKNSQPKGEDKRAHRIYFSLGYIEDNDYIEAVQVQRQGEDVFLLRPSQAAKKPQKEPVEPVKEKFIFSKKVKLEVPVVE